tara:strand:- start:123 stop:269 length:147 start_codon:yes stop_codon:yes gene_type:complete
MIKTLFFIGVVFIMIGIVKKDKNNCEPGVNIISLPYKDYQEAVKVDNI